jgi:uncharacterized protein
MHDQVHRFYDVFPSKAIIGMIHLSGRDEKEIIDRALEEARIYDEEGLAGAIVENYANPLQKTEMIHKALDAMRGQSYRMKIGVNFLPNEFLEALKCATAYNLPFIQLDHVAGKYEQGELDVGTYTAARSVYWQPLVLGGVNPKYYDPKPGFNLEESLREAMARADAIVVTGDGTGKETPIKKIKTFRQIVDDYRPRQHYPIIVGAGVTPDNIRKQLKIADGAIVGSAFKIRGNITLPAERYLVRKVMNAL